MKLFDYFENKKQKDLPLIARKNLAELQKQREEEMKNKEISILAAADYTKKLPTIRLYYVAFETFTRYGSDDAIKIGKTYSISHPYRLPNEMTIEDACKVVSYLSDKVEKENELEPACRQSVSMVSEMLGKYGFDKVESKNQGNYHSVGNYIPFVKIRVDDFPECKQIEGVTDLFTVGGDFKLFKKSNLHSNYFDWYTEGVTEQEINDIYKKIRKEHLLPDTIKQNDERAL